MTRGPAKRLPSISNDLARTEALNVAGAFFQRKVAGEFRRSGWKVLAEEYPVTYPQTGPLSERQSGAMDIWVAESAAFHGGSPGSPAISVQIECKKADPGFIDWVFFLKHGGRQRFRHLAYRHPETPAHTALFVVEENLHELVDDGRELKGNYRGIDRTKGTSARIQDAARQATLATLSTAMTLRSGPPPPIDQFHFIALIPIIITTANLFTCEFPLEDVQMQSGELPARSAIYQPRDYVVYDYPLTGSLALDPERFDTPATMPVENVEAMVKMHVPIVNAVKGLDRLIDKAYPLGVPITGL